MTNKQANEYMRTKYPNGKIVQPNKSSAPKGSYYVTFNEGGNVYFIVMELITYY